jgi:hypothetical protein
MEPVCLSGGNYYGEMAKLAVKTTFSLFFAAILLCKLEQAVKQAFLEHNY